ncbi:MAG TPA: NADH-quinone oxidoreductase subunit L, partial [Myxococcaceae bacterium]|nr:NADH-quinone oxidoreductase subunit L [Myxococcaceae bacterium]
VAWLIALAAGGAAAYAYLKFFPSRLGKPVHAFARAIRSLVQNKFYVDEIYDSLFVKPVKFISFILFKVVDSLLIDTVGVRGTAWVTARVGSLLRYGQTGDAQVYAGVMALAVLAGVGYVFITFVQVLK